MSRGKFVNYSLGPISSHSRVSRVCVKTCSRHSWKIQLDIQRTRREYICVHVQPLSSNEASPLTANFGARTRTSTAAQSSLSPVSFRNVPFTLLVKVGFRVFIPYARAANGCRSFDHLDFKVLTFTSLWMVVAVLDYRDAAVACAANSSLPRMACKV